MTKTKFFRLLSEEYKAYNISKKQFQEFRNFMLLNETPDKLLPPEEVIEKYDLREQMENDPEKKERYYVFHLIMNFHTKWARVDLEKITGHFYKGSETIQRIRGKS